MAGAEAMEVATEGEAATVAAGASGDAAYGSHLPYCRANVDHVPLAFTNDQLPIYAVNAGKEKWTKRQYTLQAFFRLPSHRGQRMKLKVKFGIRALARSLAQL